MGAMGSTVSTGGSPDKAEQMRALATAIAKETDPTVRAVLMEALTAVDGGGQPKAPAPAAAHFKKPDTGGYRRILADPAHKMPDKYQIGRNCDRRKWWILEDPAFEVPVSVGYCRIPAGAGGKSRLRHLI